MPPRRPRPQQRPPAAAAPASRVYQSSGPAPQQLLFPARRRSRVVRTYGRHRRSLPATATAAAAAAAAAAEGEAERRLRQQTLTQIDYVRSSSSLSELASDEVDGLDAGEGEEEGEGAERKKKGDGAVAKGRSTRTRRTTVAGGETGLSSGRRPSSAFHTQTLTQLLGRAGAEGSAVDDGGGLRVEDEDEDEDENQNGNGNEDEAEEDQLPLTRTKTTPAKRRLPGSGRGARKATTDPQTPSHKRIKVNLDEVPSSQPTPFTPMLDRYSPMPGRSPLREKSTNVGVPPPTAEEVPSKRPSNLVIQDSFSQASDVGLPSSSVAAETPKRQEKNAPERPEREPLAEIPVSSLELGGGGGGSRSAAEDNLSPNTRRILGDRRMFIEIPDSDDELESIGSTPFKTRSTQQTPLKLQQDFEIPSDPSPGPRPAGTAVAETPVRSESETSLGRSDKENEDDRNVPNVGDDGESTASEAELPGTPTPTLPRTRSQTARSRGGPSQSASTAPTQLVASEKSTISVAGPRTPTPAPRNVAPHGRDGRVGKPGAQPGDDEVTASEDEGQTIPTSILRKPASQIGAGKRRSTPEIATSEDSTGEGPPGTPTPVVRRVQIEVPPPSSVEEVYKETPRRPAQKSSPILQRATQGRSQHYSQGLESQRVPLEVIRSLGPQTDRSDILVSIRPELVDEIAKGVRDHEFRPYKFPVQVSRCWIYTPLPVGEVKYMATLGPAKEPGEIDSHSGLGNAEFNAGTSGYKYAHKLLQVYQLNNPVPLADMPDNGLGDGPPQKYRYVPPAIVGQLLANLRCALFAEEGDEEEGEELEEGGDGGVTVSQELEEQLRSDIIHSTQLLSDERRRGHQEEAEKDVIPSSQGSKPTARPGGASARKSDDAVAQPPAPTRSSQRIRDRNNQQQHRFQAQQTPQRRTRKTSSTFVRPSQATTASDVSSSPPSSPPGRHHHHQHTQTQTQTQQQQCSSGPASSVPRPPAPESGEPDLPDLPGGGYDASSVLRLPGDGLLSSSSQAAPLPPDSLLVDDGARQAPPPVVLDSEDDEEDGEGF